MGVCSLPPAGSLGAVWFMESGEGDTALVLVRGQQAKVVLSSTAQG
jgi:hypothetical protein